MSRIPFALAPLGRWKWPSLLVVVAVPLAFYFGSWRPSLEPPSFGTTILGPTDVGPWSVVVGTSEPVPLPGGEVTFRARFCDGCFVSIRGAEIGYGDSAAPFAGRLVRLAGDANSLEASLAHAAGTTPLHLWLVVRDWQGRTYRRSWRVR